MRRASFIAALEFAGCATLHLPDSLDDAVNQAQNSRAVADDVQHVATVTKQVAGVCPDEKLKQYDLNPEQEYWFGRSVADRLLAPYAPGKVYAPDSPAAIYLNEVGQLAAAGAEQAHREGDRPPPAHGYRFILVKDAKPGAWSTPGGFVIVTDGLIARAASEDQLAGILAHEVAHVQRGHGILEFEKSTCSSAQRAEGFDALKQAVPVTGLAGEALEHVTKFLAESAQHLVEKLLATGYGKEDEREADAFGTRYLAKANYSADGIVGYLQRVASDDAFEGDDSHPSPSDRIEAIQELIRKENLSPRHSPNEAARTPRFVKAMIDSGIRSDWNPGTDPSQAPLLPQKTASAR